MIAYYDRLSTGSTTESTAELQKFNSISNTSSNRSINSDERKPLSTLTATSQKSSPPPLPTKPPPIQNLNKSFNRNRNFRALSANVQRLISHSSSTLDDNVMSHLHHHHHSAETLATNDSGLSSISHSTATSVSLKRRLTTTTATSTTTITTSTAGSSRFKHPLSKNTCKLTQASNELINTIESNNNADPLVDAQTVNHENHCDQSDKNGNNLIELDEISDDPDDKTPTNEEMHEFPLDNSNLDGNSRNTGNAIMENNNCNKHNDDDNNNNNRKNIEQKDCSNFNEKPVERQPSAIKSNTPQYQSNDNTFLFAKSCFYTPSVTENDHPNGNVIDEAPTKPLPPPPTKTSKKSSNKSASLELSRIKLRPLSSESICSTSSTSSSGSDEHSTNQHAISYLASVESLADQSENELTPLGNILTVLERASMEIVDSERTYVDDLGQVIRG